MHKPVFRTLLLAAIVMMSASVQAGFFVEDGGKADTGTSPFVTRSAQLNTGDKSAKSSASSVSRNECEYSILTGDETLEAAIKRWAVSAGWQAPQWNYRTIYVDYQSAFCGEGGFEGAVDRLMSAENAAGIPLFATFHTNKVVVIDGGK